MSRAGWISGIKSEESVAKGIAFGSSLRSQAGRKAARQQAYGAMRRHPIRTAVGATAGLGLYANSRIGPRGPRGGYGSSGSSGLNPRSSGGYA